MDACRRLADRYAEVATDREALIDALSRPLPANVWCHTRRIAPDRFAELLADDGLHATRLPWCEEGFRIAGEFDAGRHWWFLAGLGHSQEEASMLPVKLLDPRPGDRVMDLTAAPGGKTAQIGIAIGDTGTVVANDLSRSRLRALRANLDRLGLANSVVTRVDGTSYPRAAGRFDRVLVDAPCSSEGTVRKNRRLADRLDDDAWRPFVPKQEALLRKAIRLCRPGGRIVYSTCTFAPEENEGVVDTVLRDAGSAGVSIVPASMPGLATRPGVTEWRDRTYSPALRHTLRLWPQDNDTGGFFVAVLERDAAEEDDADARPVVPLAEVENDTWQPHVIERFGLPASLFASGVVHRRNERGLHYATRALSAPTAPEAETIGLFLLKGRLRFPKLSTAGALLFGARATHNTVELDTAQRDAFLTLETFPVRPDQTTTCTGTGYVIVRHRGFPLGLAMYRPGNGIPTLESQFPKRWGAGT